MNSIIRQTHIRAIDLRDFLRTYDSSNTTAVSSWVKAASAELEPGSLIFIVEPVSLPFGLISFVRKEEEENFRITDFAVVIRKEEKKALAVSLTNNTYELRFLEALLEERARKSIIERKRFSFVAAKPSSALSMNRYQALERLSNTYAKGGTRRTLLQGNPQDEPAIALLAAYGINLHFASVNKQPIDIGSICFSLFNTDTKLPDSNRSLLRDNFVALPGDFREFKTAGGSAAELDAAQGKHIDLLFEKPIKPDGVQDTTGFNLLQSWGALGENKVSKTGDALFGQVSKEPGKGPRIWKEASESNEESKKISQVGSAYEQNLADQDIPAAKVSPVDSSQPAIVQNENSQDLGKAVNAEIKDNAFNIIDAQPGASNPGDVYQHLSQAITDLLAPQPQMEPNATPVPPKAPTNAKKEGNAAKLPAARSFDKLPAFENPVSSRNNIPSLEDSAKLLAEPEEIVLDESTASKPVSEFKTIEESKVMPEPQAVEPETVIIPEAITAPDPVQMPELAKEPVLQSKGNSDDSVSELTLSDDSLPIVNADDLEIETGEQVGIFSSADMMPSKLDDFQEPKVVMNEMASLMSKLESQVARAAKKLAVRASEIEKRLTTNLDALLHVISQEDKDSYAELVVRIDQLSKQFEALFDTLKTELAEKAASGREQVKAKLTEYQEKIDQNETEQSNNLKEEFKQNKLQFDKLVKDQESELKKLVATQTELLSKRIVAVDLILDETAVNMGFQLDDYCDNYKGRVNDKVISLLKAFDNHLEILNQDIERLQSEGKSQLSQAKREFFGKLDRLIQVTEIALSRQARKAQTELFLPRLKERKQIIEAMLNEMIQTFAEHSFSQAKAQSEGAEHSLVLARQQLKELAEERLSKLDVVGRNQQSGLEEIFKSAADPLEQNTATVVQLLKQAEDEINECEAVCTKLAQSYNLDSDPKLTSLRQEVYGKVDSLKAELKGSLESDLDQNCLKLEETTKNYHIKLNTKRADLVQQVRSASDLGLQNLRQAIHDAFHIVQSEREKYME